MKKLLLFGIILLSFSCSSSKVKEVASFQFDNAWYWVIQYEDGSSKKEIQEYVNTWANPNKTSYFFVFDNSTDLTLFSKEKFSQQSFLETVLLNNPKYGYYKMLPADNRLYDDGISLIKQIIK